MIKKMKVVEIDAKDVIADKAVLYKLIEKCKSTGEVIRILNEDLFYENDNKHIQIIQDAIEKCMDIEVGMFGESGADAMPESVMKRLPKLSFETEKLRQPKSNN